MLTKKSISLEQCEIRLDANSGRFSGYASVFGGVDSYGDTIIRGAYQTTLNRDGKPKMFFNHDAMGLPIGKWVKAKEDDKGLFVEGELTPGNRAAEDVRAALKHGTLDGLSIGFYLKAGDFEETGDGGRIINKVSKLVEVSVVTFPADSAARVDLTSVKAEDIDGISTIREFERLLRDVGPFGSNEAKKLIAKARELFGQRDAGDEDGAKAATDEIALAIRVHKYLPK